MFFNNKNAFIHLTYPRKILSRLIFYLTFLIITIYEYDVGAGDLTDPLNRLPSDCVNVLNNNLEQMRMRLQKWSNLSGGRQEAKIYCGSQRIIKWRLPNIQWRPPDELSGGCHMIGGGRQMKYLYYLAQSGFVINNI